MKLNELIKEITVAVSNEEYALLSQIESNSLPYDAFSERDQFIIENLVRKSLVSKIRHNNMVMVVAHENSTKPN